MNRAIYIIMIPVVLVVLGYSVVFRALGFAPGYARGYARLIVAVTLFYAAIWWLARKTSRGAPSGGQ